ncbi:MAG: hypothetical protein EBW68_10490, partial [Actinobacteria bacterium]|nr:hypothetical protein [Actinomycetota bacterium]
SNQNAATGTTSRMLGVGTNVSVIFSGDYNIAGQTNTGKAMTFTVDGAGTTTFNGSFNGGANNNLTNGLIKNGSGVMNLNASNALSTTATAINGGTVNLGNDYALGTAAVSMNSNSTIGVTSGTRTTANNIAMASAITGTFRADSGVNWTNSGNVTDATGLATLNKTGTGTLSLSGANTYKDTTVTAGTLNARSAGALGVAYGTQAVIAYGKASAKAFAEDDRAIRVLRTNLKNLGLAYQSANADNFIATMEKQAAISDDLLRPAYAQLAKVTLSTTKTQDLMALAFDVSAANGIDFASTVDILANAYVGNYKGLKQLYTGLTQAQLASKSFEEIQAILTKQSKGAGKAAIDTYAGSVDKLSIAADNAKESIGKGLVDLFAALAGNGNID